MSGLRRDGLRINGSTVYGYMPSTTDIVFEGGGAKGLAFAGAWAALEDAGVKSQRVIGSSAGAITALLVAAGYGASELLDVVHLRDEDGKLAFAGFLEPYRAAAFRDEEIDQSFLQQILSGIDVPGVPEFVERGIDRALLRRLVERREPARMALALGERGGAYDDQAVLTWLGNALAEIGLDPWIDLWDLREATGIELVVTATDLRARRMRALSARSAPNCPVVWAVRMSMGIPGVWAPVKWRQSRMGLYTDLDGERVSLEGHEMVDGGVLSNFPMELAYGQRRLGLLLDDDRPVAGPPTGARGRGEQLRGAEIAGLLLATMLSAANGGEDKLARYADDIVRIPTGGYSTLEFDMDEARLERLIESGRAAVEEYLAA